MAAPAIDASTGTGGQQPDVGRAKCAHDGVRRNRITIEWYIDHVALGIFTRLFFDGRWHFAGFGVAPAHAAAAVADDDRCR